ncbi:hypothetical protein [Rhodococcus tukisamuensis]|uniref:Uncharacterized protein n=1 Tax=Rhodococcus tukisamuensis TaxID=168276 RepID=A0A1G6TZK3_9NOCA|nr:hypothetical protein [Rhodococcus tukisamuensis]SDD34508.1 hypothetical protein SAMN05444580_10420 [Rhodococcus tukisamuensis]
MSCPSTTLAVWAASWLAGSSSPDDVIDAVQAWAPMHLVGAADAEVSVQWDLPWPDPEDAGPVLLLRAVRQVSERDREASIALVLPAPGDVRGLPPGTAFAGAAVQAGEGVLVGAHGRAGIGIVPSVEGPDVLRWTVFPVPAIPVPAEQIGLGEAEYELRQAVREAADALASMRGGFAPGEDDPRARIARLLAEYAHHGYPGAIPDRALRIFDTADQVAAILTVAGDAGGRAQSAAGAAAREDTLRPLWSAVRAARLGAAGASMRAVLPRT